MPRHSSLHLAASTALFLSLCAGVRLFAQEQKSPGPLPEMVPNAAGTGMVIARSHEDFTTLTLAGSSLQSEPPLLGGQQVTPAMVRELWQVKWRSNDPIDLWVIRPSGVRRPPVILYLFSYPSDTYPFKVESYVQSLVSHGAAAVGFVSALTGHRYAYRPMKEWFISELQESLGSSVHDVQMILNYLETRDDLDMSRVGMFGQGSGGTIAILAAAADPRIKTLDLLNPWGDWPDWLAEDRLVPDKERPSYLKPDFLKKLEPLEPVRYLPQLKDRRIRIQYVDDLVPMKPAKRMEAAVPPTAQVLHYASKPDFAKVASGWRLFEWISGQVTPPQETKVSAQGEPPVAAKDSRGDGKE